MKENETIDYGMAWVLSAVVSISYFFLGFITSVMSGIGNLGLVLIYSAVSTFFVTLLVSKDDVSDTQGFSGMIFVISSIIFLHTSAPIWEKNSIVKHNIHTEVIIPIHLNTES